MTFLSPNWSAMLSSNIVLLVNKITDDESLAIGLSLSVLNELFKVGHVVKEWSSDFHLD